MPDASLKELPEVTPDRGGHAGKTPGKSSVPRWYIYMIRCQNGGLYTGITTDLQRRLEEHQGKNGKGAKSLRGKGLLKVVWQQNADDRSEASKLEYRIKQLSKAEKEKLIIRQGAFVAGRL